MAERPERANANVDFAALLKRLRTAAGLTQEELAERASLSVRGISDLERGLKRRPHRETVRLLTAALRLSPEAAAAFLAASNPAETPQFDALPVPTSSFIGRDEAVREVSDILSAGATRLLTLVGPGGVGKTRLALHVAAELRERYKDGAAFVSLAAIADPSQAPGAVMRALGIKNSAGRPVFDALTAELRAKRLLLVLDNCEQAPFGPFAADLLSACPGVTVIATSRAPLHVSSEQEFEVPSLDLPDPNRLPPLDQLAGTAAVALYVARARAVKPNFALTDANALAVATICARLDGLPLAIELAAVRTKVLTPASLAELLTERLRILTDGPVDAPARHRTMRAAIAWSADLLDERERIAFRRLAVFSGGCTLEDALAVLTPDDPVAGLDDLTGLIDQSLMRREDSGDDEPRLFMLETIREFAAEQLAASNEEADIRCRHADRFVGLVQTAWSMLNGNESDQWLDRLEHEHDNLWAGFNWLLASDDSERALRLSAKLWQFWWQRGRLREGRHWLQKSLSKRHAATERTTAAALQVLGNICSDLGDYEAAVLAYEESLTLFRKLQSRQDISDTLHNLGVTVGYLGEYERARSLVEESLALIQDEQMSDRRWAIALQTLGDLYFQSGDYEQSRLKLEQNREIVLRIGNQSSIAYADYFLGRTLRRSDQFMSGALLKESLALLRKSGDARGEAYVLVELGLAALGNQDPRDAEKLHLSAVTLANQSGDRHCELLCIEGLAEVASSLERWSEAARLIGAARVCRRALCRPLPMLETSRFDEVSNRVAMALGPEVWSKIIVNAESESFDDLVNEFASRGSAA